MERLSKNFTLREFERSDVATRLVIDNSVKSEEVRNNLQDLVDLILQPISDHFQLPVRINSGYRCPELNARVGGSETSQHMLGCAADIEIPGVSNYDLACWIRDEMLPYDQLILEFYTRGEPDSGWVHVSIAPKNARNRQEELTIGRNVNRKGLHR